MENVFNSISRELMSPDLRAHADRLCHDINTFLVSKGRNPEKITCLVQFVKQKDLAREYIDLVGETGLTPFNIDGYIEDEWIAGYWGWVQDGGTNRMLEEVGVDAPTTEFAVRDLLHRGIAFIHKRMGLVRTPETFEMAIALSRHLMRQVGNQQLGDALDNEVHYARLSAIELAHYLGTHQYKRLRGFGKLTPIEVELIVGMDEELICPEDQAIDGSKEGVLHFGHLDRLKTLYGDATTLDSDQFGRMGRVRRIGEMLQPVLGTHLYGLIGEGRLSEAWSVTFVRCKQICSYIPASKVLKNLVCHGLSLMLITSIEEDLGLALLSQDQRNTVSAELSEGWASLPEQALAVASAIFATVTRYAELRSNCLGLPMGELGDYFYKIRFGKADCDLAPLTSSFFKGLKSNRRRLLWPLLVANADLVTSVPDLKPLQPYLAVAWHWALTFEGENGSTRLYREKILAHHGWKASLARDESATAKALILAHGESMIDRQFAESLSITQKVLKQLPFQIPQTVIERAINSDLGL